MQPPKIPLKADNEEQVLWDHYCQVHAWFNDSHTVLLYQLVQLECQRREIVAILQKKPRTDDWDKVQRLSITLNKEVRDSYNNLLTFRPSNWEEPPKTEEEQAQVEQEDKITNIFDYKKKRQS